MPFAEDGNRLSDPARRAMNELIYGKDAVDAAEADHAAAASRLAALFGEARSAVDPGAILRAEAAALREMMPVRRTGGGG